MAIDYEKDYYSKERKGNWANLTLEQYIERRKNISRNTKEKMKDPKIIKLMNDGLIKAQKDGKLGYVWTKEQRLQAKINNTGKKNPMYGKKNKKESNEKNKQMIQINRNCS